ncbi:MAG TPA: mycothiol synthase [Actinopolymorphaceae bacterium]
MTSDAAPALEIHELTDHRVPDPATLDAIQRVIDAATAADGVSPLDEAASLALRTDGPAIRLLAARSGELAGYAQATPQESARDVWTADVVVAPEHRRHGVGDALVRRLLALVPGVVRLWAHGPHPAAAVLAERHGLAAVRELWRMRRPLQGQSAELPVSRAPEGVTIRTFRPGLDDEGLIEVNAAAFADHPEQGEFGLADLRVRMERPWFDPAGLFVAVDASDRLIGFHWTKIHQPPVRGEDPTSPIGEIYVLGVDPRVDVRGLGTTLAIVGLRYLAARGLPAVMLYTEANNERAVNLYRKLGFEHTDTDVMYVRRPR